MWRSWWGVNLTGSPSAPLSPAAGGRLPEAEAAYRKALDVSEKAVRALPHAELRCRLADSGLNLGLLLMRRDRHEEATGVFRRLFEPELISADACKYVAWRIATGTDLQPCPPEVAVEFARKAVELGKRDFLGVTEPR